MIILQTTPLIQYVICQYVWLPVMKNESETNGYAKSNLFQHGYAILVRLAILSKRTVPPGDTENCC